MRVAFALGLFVASALPEETPRFEDLVWGFTYSTPGLRKTVAKRSPELLFTGVAGDIRIEIRVHEFADAPTAAACLEQRRKELAKKRKLKDVVAEKAILTWGETKYGAFEERHGHAFFVRGFHCFEVHAWIDDETNTSAAQIRKALGGLTLDADPGMGVRVRMAAGLMGLPDLDRSVLIAAGEAYVTGRKWGPAHPALGAAILARARARWKPDALEPDERWRLYWSGGLGLLLTGRAEEAMEWFAQAERAGADAEKTARAAYDHARAGAVAGKLDAAFAALDRAFEKEMPVGKGQLSQEKELKNLRKDPRWEDFWRRRVR